MPEAARKKPVIGIVGGIGAGKSTVAAEFEQIRCTVIDADAIGHELLNEPDVQTALRDRWGGDIFAADGTVDRARLAAIVFADTRQLESLNTITHPRIAARIKHQITASEADASLAGSILDAAILFEAGWDKLCSCKVFVDCPADLRAERAAGSKGWNEATWRLREKSQIPLDKKRLMCDYIVDNSSSISRLREQVREVFYRIVHAADRP